MPVAPGTTFLLAEDDDGHARLMVKSLRRAGFSHPVLRFPDGRALLDFLAGLGPEPHRQPDAAYILLLDFRLPRVAGVEVLRQLRAGPEFRSWPVIMLSTTDDPRDLRACRDLGCDGFLVKPVDEQRIRAALAGIVRPAAARPAATP